jgi:NitT/TauT family transport system substrate-binding protein
MVRRPRFPFAWIARAVALAAVCTLCAPSLSTADAPITIRVAGPPNEGYKDVFYGVQSGLFQKFGLDVQPRITNGGAVVLAGLAGGSYDVAYTNIVPVLQAYEHGLVFKIVSPSTLFSAERMQNAMLVPVDTTLKTAKDLNGKTVGTQSLQDLNAVAMRVWIDKNGGDASTVHFIEVPSSAAVAALTSHRVEAMALSEPLLSKALLTKKVRVFAQPQSAIAHEFQAQAYVATADFVAKNSDAMTRFAKAMHESALYNNAHLADTVQLVSSFSAVPPDVIAHSVRSIDAEYVSAKNIQPLIDAAAKYGMIAKAFPAEDIIASTALTQK